MYLGRIVEIADTDTLFKDPQHPYTRALLDSVLTPDPNMGIPNNQLGASYPNPIDPPTGCSFHPRCVNAMPNCATIAPNGKVDGGHYVECHLYGDSAS
jgi:peptide/nickel transport system ATP-binding protein